MKYNEVKRIASGLRKNQTPGEKILWQKLRRKQLKGKKFLRQHAIVYESIEKEHFFFVPDFYCSEEKLIIEIDGGVHDNQLEKDLRRDEILKSLGYRILRIKSEELMFLDEVVKKIEKMLHND